MVTQHSNSCKTQNPVIIFANIYKRVMGLKGATINTPVNTFFNTTTNCIK